MVWHTNAVLCLQVSFLILTVKLNWIDRRYAFLSPFIRRSFNSLEIWQITMADDFDRACLVAFQPTGDPSSQVNTFQLVYSFANNRRRLRRFSISPVWRIVLMVGGFVWLNSWAQPFSFRVFGHWPSFKKSLTSGTVFPEPVVILWFILLVPFNCKQRMPSYSSSSSRHLWRDSFREIRILRRILRTNGHPL